MELVKLYENGFITKPQTLKPSDPVSKIDAIKRKYGFSGVPITENGKMGEKLVGIVTNRDIDFLEDRSTAIADVMTPFDSIIYATERKSDCGLSEYNKVMIESKKGKLPVLNDEHELVGLMSRCDLLTNQQYPDANKDDKKRYGQRQRDRVCTLMSLVYLQM